MDRDAGASTRFSSKVKLLPRLRLKWRSPPLRRKDECVMKQKFLLARFFVGTLFASLMCDSACNARAEEVKDFGREQLNNSPRHGEWVDIKSGERTIKAFVDRRMGRYQIGRANDQGVCCLSRAQGQVACRDRKSTRLNS